MREVLAAEEAADGAPDLVCVTIPFPGTLPGALVFAEEAKRALGPRLPVAFGGGYVSTELRSLRDPGIFAYTDYLCYDTGYAALAGVMACLAGSDADLYKTIVRRGPCLVAHGFEGADLAFQSSEPSYQARLPAPEQASRQRAFDEEAIRQVFPDFSGLDFSRYIRIVEGTNPMHALWSGAAWMKGRLAYGCYWRTCSFCDTSLEYIARYSPSSPEALFAHLCRQAGITGQRGVHFVDEAMPLGHLVRFGLENLRHGRPLLFWGNVRLEKLFTPDSCALLAEAGLVGVSFGLEVATETGLGATRKGISLGSIVTSLAALRHNGILAHAYLIYGWPGQSEADLVDSMEIVRQLFAEGLLVSAFWHRFILTRHSPIYAEWREGKRPSLRVIEPEWTFGTNDLSFEGEEDSARYGEGLDAALGAWMEGEDLDRPVRSWFEGRVARPGIDGDFIAKLAAAADRRARAPAVGRGRNAVWLGGRLLAEAGDGGRTRLTWAYRNEVHAVEMESARADTLRAVLERTAVAPLRMDELLATMNREVRPGEPFETAKAFRTLRRFGLAAC